MLENNISRDRLRCYRIVCILDINRYVKVVEDTLEQGHRPDPLDLDIKKAVDRHIHPSKERYEHGDVTDRKVRIVLHHEDAACKVDQHRTDARKGRKNDSEPAACHALLDVKADHLAVGFLVSVIFIFLFAEELYKELAAYGQSLIQDAVDLIIYLL